MFSSCFLHPFSHVYLVKHSNFFSFFSACSISVSDRLFSPTSDGALPHGCRGQLLCPSADFTRHLRGISRPLPRLVPQTPELPSVRPHTLLAGHLADVRAICSARDCRPSCRCRCACHSEKPRADPVHNQTCVFFASLLKHAGE